MFGKKAAATTVDTAATTANTAATTANATATALLAKAKEALSKALAVGKWVALGAAVAGAGVLIYQFAKDSDAAGQMVMNFADNISGMVNKAVAMIPQIAQAFTAALPVIIQAGVKIFTSLVDGLCAGDPADSCCDSSDHKCADNGNHEQSADDNKRSRADNACFDTGTCTGYPDAC